MTMFIEKLLIIVKTKNNTNVYQQKRIKKFWWSHTIEYYMAIRISEPL